jgi:hypothetical protein
VKISNKNFSFFLSRNQYFPHIPYVASKKWCTLAKINRNISMYGQFSVKTPTPVHPFLKFGKPLQICFIFSLHDALERKQLKNCKKNL